jgi:DNA-binding transcriptional MerR regulator
MGRELSIGDVAVRSGVSARALRLYETAGLIRPRRTGAGRRVFDAADLGRLQHILLLKKAGYTLGQIADLLRRRQLDPAELIDLQIAALDRRHRTLGAALGTLKAARRQLTDGQVLTVDALCDLIKLGEDTMTQEVWQSVWDRYYTPEEQERWKAVNLSFSAEDGQAYARQWTDLIAQVEAAMAKGVKPQDTLAMNLAKAWYDLQKPMMDRVGADVWNKAARMYQEMDQWQTDTVKAPFSKAAYQFIAEAAEAARAQGMIPPRKTPE